MKTPSTKKKVKEKCEYCLEEDMKPKIATYECEQCGTLYCNRCSFRAMGECMWCPLPRLVKLSANKPKKK